MTSGPNTDRPSPLAAMLSALLPGLGQATKRELGRAAAIFLTGAALLGALWAIRPIAGGGSAIFLMLLVVLPWWAIQTYDAFLPTPDGAPSFRNTLRIILNRAHDIRFLGWLFLITAFMDFYIIAANPNYALNVFCGKPTGLLGLLFKAQSPTLHVLIGYGFIRLRRWSLLLYFAYAAFGLLNATANFACFGYGRVRAVFLLSLIGFTAYVWWRRTVYRSTPLPVQGFDTTA